MTLKFSTVKIPTKEMEDFRIPQKLLKGSCGHTAKFLYNNLCPECFDKKKIALGDIQ